MAKVLTPEQQDAYFKEQDPLANPISPLEWLAQQSGGTPTKTDDVMKQDNSGRTVFSDINAREKIPELESKVNKLSETGQFYDQQGNLRNADGSVVDDERLTEIDTLEADAEDIRDDIDTMLEDLQTKSDADTARQIQAIKQMYKVRKDQQRDINMRTEAGVDTVLLLGGTSRYAISGGEISAAQKRAGIMELAELDAEEQSLIAQAKTAQTDRDFRMLEKNIARLEEKREEKLKKAKGIAEDLAKENKEIRQQTLKFNRETAIAEAFQNGVTDPSAIQTMLEQQGMQVDLEEIDRVMGIIEPPEELAGVTADLKTFKQFFPDADITTKEGRQTYLDWQQAVGNAKRKASGGDGGGGDGTDEEEFTFEDARSFVADNPNATRAELKSALLERGFNVSDANAILDEAESQDELIELTDERFANLVDDLAVKIVKKSTQFGDRGEFDRAKRLVEGGILKSGDKEIRLSKDQIDVLLAKMEEKYPDEQRTVPQRILPGGK